MKKIFTLFAGSLFALFLNTVEAQVTENFTNPPSCIVLSGGAALTGTGINGQSVALNSSKGTSTVETPYMDVTTGTISIAFKYKLSSTNKKTRTVQIGYRTQSGNFEALSSVINVTSTAVLTATYNGAIPSGTYRIVIQGTADGSNENVLIDDLSISGNYHYTVNGPCNLAPTAVNDTYTASTLSGVVNGNVVNNDTDPNNTSTVSTDILGPVNLVPPPASQGTLNMNANGSFTFTPAANFTGGDVTFTYQVNDNGFDPLTSTNTATVTLHYPKAPTAIDDNYFGNPNMPFTGNVITNTTGADIEPNAGQTLTATVVTNPSTGTVSLNTDGSFTYTPATDFAGGNVTFTYRVTDASYAPLFSNTATVTITYPEQIKILPVKLISFQGTMTKERIQLQWSVAENEIANRFEVEKSTDGKNFILATVVMSSNKSGNEVYQINEAAATTRIMYRLKMFDKDGYINYSKIVAFQPATTAPAATFKVNTATTDRITATITATANEEVQFAIYDLSGKLVQQQAVRLYNGQNALNVSLNNSIKTGIYVAELSSNSQRQTTKFFIQ